MQNKAHTLRLAASLILGATCAFAGFYAMATSDLPPAPPGAIAPAAPADAPLLELPSASKPAAPAIIPVPVSPVAPPAAVTLPTAAIPVPSHPALPAAALPASPPAAVAAPAPAPALPSSLGSQGAPPITVTMPPKPGGTMVITHPVTPGAAAADSTAPKIMSVIGQPDVKILEEPVSIAPAFSLMFSRKSMQTVVIPGLDLFDKTDSQAKVTGENNTEGKDDLTGLLESLKEKGDETKPAAPAVPNLYLGSIVYYTPDNWSIWINGKKLVTKNNKNTNSLYVSRLDRSQVTLVWKPQAMARLIQQWNQTGVSTDALPPNVAVDTSKGTMSFTLHPNQTFLPRQLLVREGLVK